MLPVAGMFLPVAPAVTQVDSADEGHIASGAGGVPDDDELLVMRAAQSHTLVEQDLAAGRIDLFSKMAVLPGAEPEPVQV
jgi:hypothetical protein